MKEAVSEISETASLLKHDMNSNIKLVKKIIERYFKGEYSPAGERMLGQWIAYNVPFEEIDYAMRALWDELQVEPEKSVHASYKKVKGIIGF